LISTELKMPTYEYVCDECGHNFDELQSFSDEPLKKCPKCGKKKLRRLFGTGAAVLFKGSGFYETDYRSESYKQAQKKESESSTPAATDAGKSTSSDSAKSSSTESKSSAAGDSAKSAKAGPAKK
jgi:putative FmdB family regulatory protein